MNAGVYQAERLHDTRILPRLELELAGRSGAGRCDRVLEIAELAASELIHDMIPEQIARDRQLRLWLWEKCDDVESARPE